MKLLNQSIKYLSVLLLMVVSIWAVVFYFNMLQEIKESIDEGLENYKRQIIYQAEKDSAILQKSSFDEGFFLIREIPQAQALLAKDRYSDTLMYMQDADDEAPELEPVRMLTTTFENRGRYYELSMINSMVEEDDLVEELLREAIWLYLVLVISIIAINNVVLKRLWKPFYDLLSQLKNYRLGSSKSLPAIDTSTKEFKDLQEVVNTSLQHSVTIFEQQKEFIGNASHELQTPLAIAINKMELLLEKGNLDSSEAQTVAEVLQTIERLVQLNKSLLLLSKIENKQFLDNETISGNDIVAQVVTQIEEIALFKEVEISIKEHADIAFKMDPSLANIMLANLVRNAVFHNHKGGRVVIEIDAQVITVRNSGNEKLNAESIFKRFHKSDKQSGGTGLGLAIVKAIADLYSFHISYSFEEQCHCFKINLTGN